MAESSRSKRSGKNKKTDEKTIRLFQKICENFKAPEDLTVSEWADKYRMLSPENSAEAGRWRTERTPYLREIMDAFTEPKVKKVIVVACAQLGKTECMANMLGYMIDQDPGPAMLIMPTGDMAEDYSKRRLAPMVRDTKPLKEKVSEIKSRNANNTITKKNYPGGMLSMVGSNSPASLASVPSRYIFGDEIDRWAKSAGTEGDPWSLVEARTITFYNSKMVAVSTPTIKGDSKIDSLFKNGTQEYWCVQCPHCGEYSFIVFDNIRFKYHEIKNGREIQYIVDETGWACPKCGCYSDEQTIKHQPMKWVADTPEAIANGTRSFWINGFSSPWLPWTHIITKFLESRKDPEQLQVVYNTLFGQLWENRGDIADEETVSGRAEDYEAELPDGVLCLTCGVDTQDNRLEYEVVGYGFFEENWGIEKGIIDGKPDNIETWIKLDGVLDKVYK
ncbi:MAG: phage terminase large subunit family protein, partial [Butyrivibrio sp.]|nr:phage terminase large subunit family protein [Butyrivibrio sp.]